jgi:phage/plasmid-associated DNA primase
VQVNFKIRGVQIYACNKLPEINDFSDGTKRRLCVVSFDSHYVAQPNPNIPTEKLKDPSIKDKIDLWGPTFMSMSIARLMSKNALEYGFEVSPMVRSWTLQYFTDEQERRDPLGSWMNKRFAVDKGSEMDDDGIIHTIKLTNDELYSSAFLTIPDIMRLYKKEVEGDKTKSDIISAIKTQQKYVVHTDRFQKVHPITNQKMDFKYGVVFNIKLVEITSLL